MKTNRPHGLRSRRAIILGISAGIGGGTAIENAAWAQGAELEEVIVTGSRIARRDFSAASPIVTVSAETLEQSGTVSIESVLNQLPMFVPTGTQFASAEIEASAFTTPGISNLNLRGLGSNRNLVLVDGRRLQPANATLVVDVGTIPSAAIQSVEAISGGASSVYGADAISGVVNFVLKRNFEGIDLDLHTGMTAEGDGEESRFSALIGGNFADGRGNAMFGAEWSRREPVFQADRDFYVQGWRDPGTNAGGVSATYWNPPGCNGPAVGCPTQAAVNTAFSEAAPGAVNRANNFYLNEDGTVFQTQGAVSYNGPLGEAPLYRKVQVNNNNNLGETNSLGFLSSPLERYSLFGRSYYEISDSITAFVQGTFSQVEVDSIGPFSMAVNNWAASIPHGTDLYAPSLAPDGSTQPDYVSGGAYGLNCPPVGGCTNSQAYPTPPELTALLDSRPNANAPWALERVFDWAGPRATNNTSSVYQIQTGLEGTFENRDWTWEAYVSHGQTTIDSYLHQGFASDARWKAVSQAPNYGRNFSEGSTANAFGYNISCETGLPLVESFTPSPDCIDALEARLKMFTRLEQSIIEANLQGGIVEMPAGELRFAAGISRRKNSVLFEPDPLVDQQSTRDAAIGLFASNETGGESDVSEIYGELLVPVVGRLDLELGWRYSDYDTTGGVETYKALFDWAATDSFRLRGGRQIANRAPNTAERFTGPTLNVVGFPGSDPCAVDTTNEWGNVPSNPDRAQVQALCSAIIDSPTSDFDADPDNFTGPFGFFQLEIEEVVGNPEVNSEQAETYTIGAVVQRDNWSFSVDYYDIEITGAIQPISAFNVYQQCFNYDGQTNPEYSLNDPGGFCSRIIRDPVMGWRAQVQTPYSNLGRLSTDGVDVQLNWNGEVATRSMFVNVLLSMVNSYEVQPTVDGEVIEYAGTLGAGGQYDYRLNTSVGYDLGSANIGLRWIHLPEVENGTFATNPATTVQPTDAYNRFDLFGSWSIRDEMQLRFGIDNLLDADPEIVGFDPGVNNAMGSTNAGYYDVLGRRYYVGLRFSF